MGEKWGLIQVESDNSLWLKLAYSQMWFAFLYYELLFENKNKKTGVFFNNKLKGMIETDVFCFKW